MLVEFTVGNFLSFKNPVTFSMVASSIKEHQEKNTFSHTNLTLLKSAIIYGANASGKSNLFTAMRFMRNLIINSSKNSQIDEEINVEPFRLNKESRKKPSTFEIVFIIDSIRYRYGFEVNSEKVIEEWLFSAKKNVEKELFYRDKEGIVIGNQFKEGKDLEKKTRKNALFLSVVANFNGEVSSNILKWFNNLNIMSGSNNRISKFTKNRLQDNEYKKKIVEFLKVADLGIEDISIEKIKLSEVEGVPPEVKKILKDDIDIIITLHKNPNDNSTVPFQAERDESEGTVKLLSLSAPIIDTLEKNKVLIIDELDAKFHPLITRFIIDSFNSNNNQSAQLIFNTHDTSHLTKEYFRRDQVWFAEKDNYGCTDLYSLVEYKMDDNKIRNDASYSKDYIRGKYGAIPYIGHQNFLGEHGVDGEGQSISQEEKEED